MRLSLLPILLLPLACGCGGKDDTAGEDLDGDGYGAARDCDDDDPDVHPDRAEQPYNGVDDDCDESTPDDDLDGDGYGRDEDCDDDDAAAYPAGAEICDGHDNDCDGTVDNGALDAIAWYDDRDGDGFGDPDTRTLACDQPFGFVQDDTDCDDRHAEIHPGAEEVWDGVDNDCDGAIDEDGGAPTYTWHHDGDGDGFGDPRDTLEETDQPYGYVSNGTDCDDADPEVHPGADEVCDQVDDDCDGDVDEDDVCRNLDVTEADDHWLGDAAGDTAGAALAGGQDLTGDGRDDMLVGSPESAFGGEFYVVPGSYVGYETGNPVSFASSSGGIHWEPPREGWGLGASLAWFADLDGDGDADFGAGSPGATGYEEGAGIAVIWLSAAEDYTMLYGESAGGALGTALAALGDVDADGLSDLAVGAPGVSGDIRGQGQVDLYLGDASEGVTLAASWLGEGLNDDLGAAVCSAGDLDGDGYDELAMGATGYSAGAGNGAVYVVMGQRSWGGSGVSASTADFRILGTAGHDQLGAAIAGGGDLDGDGYDDLAMGAPYDSGTATGAGAVYLWTGGPIWAGAGGTWAAGAAPTVFGGESGGSHAGASLSLLPDFDADGLADLAVGAPRPHQRQPLAARQGLRDPGRHRLGRQPQRGGGRLLLAG
ncbi:MAG: MopE-related protein [Pseudomonadota bacterium]